MRRDVGRTTTSAVMGSLVHGETVHVQRISHIEGIDSRGSWKDKKSEVKIVSVTRLMQKTRRNEGFAKGGNL